MDPTISPSCATWLSMSCERTTPSLPCVESSSSQAGMTNTWPSLSLNFEMRLPWLVLLLNGVCTPTTQLALLNSIAIRQRARASLRAVDVVSTKRASIGLSYARLVVVCIHRTGTTTLAAPAQDLDR